MARRFNTLAFTAVVALLGLGCAAILYFGWQYYHMPPLVQSSSKVHGVYGSAGTLGLSLGIAALGLFITNVAYLPRKLLVTWHWLGSLRGWLGWHVASGLIGAAMVALHAAFNLRSEVTTVCIYALLIVLATGVIGRYLVTLIPRTRYGERMTLASIGDELMDFIDAVRDAVMDEPQAIEVLQQIVDAVEAAQRGDAMSLGETIKELRQANQRMRFLRRSAAYAPGVDQKQLKRLLNRAGKRYKQAVLVHVVSRVLDSWRALHRVLAIVFVITVFIHVGWAFSAGFGAPWP